jgi:hypothetical protein
MMSRASLPAQVMEIINISVDKLAQKKSVSRASLRRQLIRVARFSLEKTIESEKKVNE